MSLRNSMQSGTRTWVSTSCLNAARIGYQFCHPLRSNTKPCSVRWENCACGETLEISDNHVAALSGGGGVCCVNHNRPMFVVRPTEAVQGGFIIRGEGWGSGGLAAVISVWKCHKRPRLWANKGTIQQGFLLLVYYFPTHMQFNLWQTMGPSLQTEACKSRLLISSQRPSNWPPEIKTVTSRFYKMYLAC